MLPNQRQLLETFEDLQKARGKKTAQRITNYTKHFLNWLKTNTTNYYLYIHYNDLLQYINYLKTQENQPHTINQKLQAIEHFYT